MKEKKNATADFVSTESTKTQKEVKKAKKKDKKPGFFKKLGGKIKDVFSELKKVSWPTFGKVVKQTGVVLAVVLIFLVLITAFDQGLLALVKLISK
ncbi:MAG: preprotein translocase subunit SecE [Clostridiales bacterium]|jgi:preprotein translocase subunit SecE|nr:preprotein translocase subunit SecE [Clostridiales bacterium]